MNQYRQFMYLWTNTMGNTSQSFGTLSGNSIPFFQAMSQINPQSSQNWYSGIMRATQRCFAPFMGSTTKGDIPTMDAMSDMAERWGKYMSKVSQMQMPLRKTSISAWDKDHRPEPYGAIPFN
ncbi:MAG TPA: hypothetical protein VHK69_04625 [Chitinophagaceae bacterium]|nr:hypothetical protein [Chitinophagaceae bacterium]